MKFKGVGRYIGIGASGGLIWICSVPSISINDGNCFSGWFCRKIQLHGVT